MKYFFQSREPSGEPTRVMRFYLPKVVSELRLFHSYNSFSKNPIPSPPWTHAHDSKMKYTHEAHWHSAAKISRWRSLLRSWWLSAGRMLSPPTTSITLRQKQGGEQKTCSGGPLQKKSPSHSALREDVVTFKSFQICNPYIMHSARLLFWIDVPDNLFFKKLLCLLSLWFGQAVL